MSNEKDVEGNKTEGEAMLPPIGDDQVWVQENDSHKKQNDMGCSRWTLFSYGILEIIIAIISLIVFIVKIGGGDAQRTITYTLPPVFMLVGGLMALPTSRRYRSKPMLIGTMVFHMATSIFNITVFIIASKEILSSHWQIVLFFIYSIPMIIAVVPPICVSILCLVLLRAAFQQNDRE